MTDMPAPAPDQPLVKSLQGMYERGDLGAIENTRQQRIDESVGDNDKRAKLLARFEEARVEAYNRYQAAHETPEKDRIKAAKALAKERNSAAPPSDAVVDLYRPMQVVTTLNESGSFVEDVQITKWELDPETNMPRLAEIDPDELGRT